MIDNQKGLRKIVNLEKKEADAKKSPSSGINNNNEYENDYMPLVDNINEISRLKIPFDSTIQNNEQQFFCDNKEISFKPEKFESIFLSLERHKVKVCAKPWKHFLRIKFGPKLDYFFIAYAYFCIFAYEKYEKKNIFFNDFKTKFCNNSDLKEIINYVNNFGNSWDREYRTIYNFIKDPKFKEILRFHLSRIKYKPDCLNPEKLAYYSFDEISSCFPIYFNISYIQDEKVSLIDCCHFSRSTKISIIIDTKIQTAFLLFEIVGPENDPSPGQKKIILSEEKQKEFEYAAIGTIDLFFNYNKEKIVKKMTNESINNCIKNIEEEFKNIDEYRNEGYYLAFLNMKNSIKLKISDSNSKLEKLVAIAKYYKKNEKCEKCDEIGEIISLPCEMPNILRTCYKCREKFLIYFAKHYASEKSCINCDIFENPNPTKEEEEIRSEHNDIYSLLKCVFPGLKDHIPSNKEPPIQDSKNACMYCGFNSFQNPLSINDTCIGNMRHFLHLECLQKEMKEQISSNKNINNLVCHFCFSPIKEELMNQADNELFKILKENVSKYNSRQCHIHKFHYYDDKRVDSKKCEHSYYMSCIKKYVHSHFGTSVNLVCPVEGCKVILSEELIAEIYNKY